MLIFVKGLTKKGQKVGLESRSLPTHEHYSTKVQGIRNVLVFSEARLVFSCFIEKVVLFSLVVQFSLEGWKKFYSELREFLKNQNHASLCINDVRYSPKK